MGSRPCGDVALLGFMLVGTDESDCVFSAIGLALYFAAWIGAFVYALVVGPRVPWPPKGSHMEMGPPPHAPYDPIVAAVAGVQAVRVKRDEARAIARRDPAMARELRIGRPDLPRQYDDGGLIDVNSAPAEVLQ